jgi:hypothetical protein
VSPDSGDHASQGSEDDLKFDEGTYLEKRLGSTSDKHLDDKIQAAAACSLRGVERTRCLLRHHPRVHKSGM